MLDWSINVAMDVLWGEQQMFYLKVGIKRQALRAFTVLLRKVVLWKREKDPYLLLLNTKFATSFPRLNSLLV